MSRGGSSAVDRLARLRALIAAGDFERLLATVTDRLLPVGNPALYWDRFVIVQRDPAGRSSDAAAAPAVTLAAPGEIDALCAARPAAAPLLRRRVTDGQGCHVVRDHGAIVAHAWAMPDRPLYRSNSGLTFRPPTRPARWIHDVWVSPAERRRGHYRALIDAIAAGEGGRPAPHLYAEVHALNRVSLTAHARAGFRVVRAVTVVSVLGLKVFLVTDPTGGRVLACAHALRVPHN